MKPRHVAIAAFSLAMSLGFAGSVEATGVRALFLAGDFFGSEESAKNDIIGLDSRFDQAGSAAYNYYTFSNGNNYPGTSGNPTLSYLQQFDSVLFWANYSPNSALGDILADYVDSGGGVVIATFVGFYQDPYYDGLGFDIGRLDDDGYNPLSGGTMDAHNSVSLGAFNASDPLMLGVNSLSSPRYNGDYLGVRAGSTLAASWDNGRPLAAYNAAHNVAGVTLLPSVEFNRTGLDSHAFGDYRTLFANALAFTAAGTTAVPEPGTWALLIGGLGLAGVALRRRKTLAA